MSHHILTFILDARDAQIKIPHRQRQLLAGLLLALSGFSVAAMMATFKLSQESLSLPQTIFLRTFSGILLTLPLFALVPVGLMPEGRFGLYAARIGLAIAALTCWLYSIAHMPLALASALSFSKSIFMLWLAAAFMSEKITGRKLFATVLGFVGVVLALDPQGAADIPMLAAAVGLVGALLGGMMTVVVKQLSSTEPTLRMMLYPHLGVSAVFLIPAIQTWQPIDGGTLWLIAGMAVFGSISQWCFVTSYRLGDISALAPVEYTRLLAAALFGYAIFSEVPTLTMTLGMVLVCLSAYAALSPRTTERPSI
ncbi:MAG: DMT family transporter [Pseudomonadota bacterium]